MWLASAGELRLDPSILTMLQFMFENNGLDPYFQAMLQADRGAMLLRVAISAICRSEEYRYREVSGTQGVFLVPEVVRLFFYFQPD
jgi:hypothetical protein